MNVRINQQHFWYTPKQATKILGYSTQQLRVLEDKGLPSRGSGRSKKHPMPDANVWVIVYQWRLAKHRNVRWLNLDEADAEYQLVNLQTDPPITDGQPARYDKDGWRLIPSHKDVNPSLHHVAPDDIDWVERLQEEDDD